MMPSAVPYQPKKENRTGVHPAYSGIRGWIRRLGLSGVLMISAVVTTWGQPDSLARLGITEQQESAAKAWLEDLYDFGVEVKGDSVFFNEETRRIAADSMYRKIIYPDAYSWPAVQALMQRKALKPTFWYLINLYHSDAAHQELVMQMILPFDQLIEMDRVLVATYYTYIAFDPQVYHVVNGRTTEVRRPDIAEQKLLATKAIVDRILGRRALRANKR